ncbi:MAG: gamma-glutamyl-gamma-aminobutyrate hydrolase family protein, partial [Oleispira sp.]|nr:gamma-glutamyl-gamma-aminobutyrate hydrolase family protein [Oleispira sp.]
RGIPVLGICLGHEIIGEVFGGRIRHARKVMHGKSSNIYHSGDGMFRQIRSGFSAARYHSLVVDSNSLPSCLEVSAWTHTEEGEVDEIMGLSHVSLPIYGVQFHPESILTEQGHTLLNNFVTICESSAFGSFDAMIGDNHVPK